MAYDVAKRGHKTTFKQSELVPCLLFQASRALFQAFVDESVACLAVVALAHTAESPFCSDLKPTSSASTYKTPKIRAFMETGQRHYTSESPCQ